MVTEKVLAYDHSVSIEFDRFLYQPPYKALHPGVGGFLNEAEFEKVEKTIVCNGKVWAHSKFGMIAT